LLYVKSKVAIAVTLATTDAFIHVVFIHAAFVHVVFVYVVVFIAVVDECSHFCF
jgi:hypothetical protein